MNAIPLLPCLRIEQTLELVTDAGDRTVIARSVVRQIALPVARGVCESVPGGSSLSDWVIANSGA